MALTGWEWIGRLAVAAVLSGAIGWERAAQSKAAGLRTHMLVGLGSALFTAIGASGFESGDPTRLAAAVVTGIGFLGAGAIFRHGPSVRGLTTAAGLWVASAIGLVAGTGAVGPALAATGLAVAILSALTHAERQIRHRRDRRAVPVTFDLGDPTSFPTLMAAIRTVDEHAHECRVEVAGERLRVTVLADPRVADTVTALTQAFSGELSAD